VRPLSDRDRRIARQVIALFTVCLLAVLALSFVTQRLTVFLLVTAALVAGQTALIGRADDPNALRAALAPSGRRLAIGGVVVMLVAAAAYLAAA
jgi:uncharacterized membrane protein